MGAAHPKGVLAIEFGGYSAAGLREENQDAFAAALPVGDKGAVAVIADGVSTASRAAEASQTVVQEFIAEYQATPRTWQVKDAAAKVLNALNRWLCHHEGMVTTFSALIVKGQTAHIFHTGDCRIYRMRDNSFEQLTRDHRNAGALTRVLGMEFHLEVDYQTDEILKGDRYLLVTDGVHDVLSKAVLGSHFGAESLEFCARAAVESSIEQGSDDNCSCLLVEIVDVPHESIDEAHKRLTRQAIPPLMNPGVTLDEFTVKRVLFSGTRSYLYLVENEQGKQMVLKAPSVSFQDDLEYLEGFMREEWIGKRLDNPGVMKIYDRPHDSRFLYYVAEYIEGQTLRQWINDHPNPHVEEVRRIANELTKALRALHRAQMVHRDLKPENIMIDSSGQVKLIDFGSVYVAGFDEAQVAAYETHPVGSVGYVAPECLLNQPATFRTDLYALGVVVYEMLTGNLPHKAPLSREPEAWLHRDYISLRKSGREDLPEWLDLTLQKTLMRNPLHRYNALSEFITDLSQPNPEFIRQIESAPFIERRPLLFWQLTSTVFFILLMLSLLINLTD